MKKLTLNLEALAVESFATDDAERGAKGTVHAHNHTRGGHVTCGGTCDAANTCDCQITSPVSCLETQCNDTFCGPVLTDDTC
ncbi:MAG TPA: hypothetical protein VF746_09845 [Longimicrobium sp.]